MLCYRDALALCLLRTLFAIVFSLTGLHHLAQSIKEMFHIITVGTQKMCIEIHVLKYATHGVAYQTSNLPWGQNTSSLTSIFPVYFNYNLIVIMTLLNTSSEQHMPRFIVYTTTTIYRMFY